MEKDITDFSGSRDWNERDSEGPENDIPARYRPDSLTQLVQDTHFSRKQLQLLYRGFKHQCPNGALTLEELTTIYSQLCPHGDCKLYATYVYNCFDVQKNGHITFRDLVMGLSVLSKGTIEDKLKWIFNLYDVNKDGIVSTNDIDLMIRSVYRMMGNTNPPINEKCIQEHVKYAVIKLDVMGDGRIHMDDFLHTCLLDYTIINSLSCFVTV